MQASFSSLSNVDPSDRCKPCITCISSSLKLANIHLVSCPGYITYVYVSYVRLRGGFEVFGAQNVIKRGGIQQVHIDIELTFAFSASHVCERQW